MRIILPLIAVTLTAGCQRPPETEVDGAWVRLAAAPGRPAGGYFTLHGGAIDRTLTGVRSPVARLVELHETMKMSGMGGMTMTPVGQVALPAGKSVAFAPGGKHLMLFDVATAIKPGDTIPLSFNFADGKALTVNATAIAAGDPPPAP